MIILWALAAVNVAGLGWLAWRMVSVNRETEEQTATRTFDCRDCGGTGCATCNQRGTITLPPATGQEDDTETEPARQEPSPYHNTTRQKIRATEDPWMAVRIDRSEEEQAQL